LGQSILSLCSLRLPKSALVNAIKSKTQYIASAAVPRCTMRSGTTRRHAAGERKKPGYARTGIALVVE
jgi:hypothetical protein